MSEDFGAQLASYRLQLQQVETAMLGEPDNQELVQLKNDLLEVINLTKELVAPPASTSSNDQPQFNSERKWKAGDKCMAKSSKDGKFYQAVIDNIAGETVAVTFTTKKATDICQLHDLREWVELEHKFQKIRAVEPIGIWTGGKSGKKQESGKKLDWLAEKEKKRKKLAKRILKQKEAEHAREKDKQGWQKWTNKAKNKGLKGVKKNMLQKETRESAGVDHLAANRQIYGQAEYQRP